MSAQLIDELPVETVARFVQAAPVNVDALAEALGLTVHVDAFLGPDVAGKIIRAGGRYSIFLNPTDSPRRQRFTLAHEIAHYVLHRDLIGDGITDDGMYRSSLGDQYERQANRMAADILLPAALVRAQWRSGNRGIAPLAKFFHVSEQAMRIRLQELGFAA